MGNFDDGYDHYLKFDSEDEDENMTPRPASQSDSSATDDKHMEQPISPPNSAVDEDAADDDEDLYGTSTAEQAWNSRIRRESAASTSHGSPVNPQWLLSNDPPRHSSLMGPESQTHGHHPSPPTSEDAKTPSDRSGQLETIQEGKAHLITTGPPAKSSKSFPLYPTLLNLKQADDDDEKMLASDEGRKLGPRERRQLRNKVSARNFRVRRKEYIGHLENLVENQTHEIESLRQSLNQLQVENNQLRQESGFLRSMTMPHQQPSAQAPPPEPVMPSPHTKDVNPNTFDWPLAYDGMSSPTQSSSNKFNNRPMFGGQIHAYEVRVPEVQFDQKHLNNPAPPLPPPAPQQQPYTPTSPRSPQQQDTTKQPPAGAESLGYPGMLQAVTYLYDYIVKNSPGQPGPPPQQAPLPAPYPHHPVTGFAPPPQPWPETKMLAAPTLGFNNNYNGSWGWGGPPGPPV